VVLSSTGASDVNVAVSGTVYKAAPIAHVTGFSSGTITTANIPLSWTVASPQPDGYLIRVSSTTVTDPVNGTALADSTNVSGGTGAVNVAGSATGYSGFTGFAAGTLYSFKIYPYNNSGGNIRYLTASVPSLSSQELLPVAPSAAPTFSAVSASGFTVTWNAVAGADDYRLDISTVSNFATFVSGYENLTVSATSRVVTGLGGGTTYYVRVRAANLAGSGANSATASQNTLPANDSSSAPTSLTVNGSAANGITVGATVTAPFTDTKPDVWFSFTAPATGTVTLTTTSSTAQDLDLSAWEDAAPTTVTTEDKVSSGQDGGDTTEVATMSVTSGKTYFIRVFRYSGTAGSFTLSGTMPLAAPVTLAASGVTSSGFTANWNAVAGATGYRVDVYSGGSTSTVFEANFSGFTGAGFAASPTAGQLDSDTWIIRGMSDSAAPAFGATLTTADFNQGSSSGGVSNAGIYAFTVATGNTALGVQPTANDFTPGEIVLRIQNTSGATINNLTVSYKVYVLNNDGRANSFNFSHSSDDTNYNAVSALDYTSQDTASASPAWVPVTRSATLTGLSIANNSFYYLRWSSDDVSGSGNRDEFALDDVSVTTTTATYLHTNVDAGSSTSFAVTGAAATTAYSYVVRAVSATETSANSDVRTVATKGTSSIAVNGGTTSLTYSGAAQGPTFTVTGSTGAVTYSYAGTGGTSYEPSATAPTNVGSYTVTATAAADTNFDGATSSATAFTINAASLASNQITLTPGAGSSYSASGPEESSFIISYSGRNQTSYGPSASAPTAAGFYTVTASATGNYSGSNSADFSITGLMAIADSLTKPANNQPYMIPVSQLLANDFTITNSSGATVTTGLSISAVTGGAGNTASYNVGDRFIQFTPSSGASDTFTYTVTDGVSTATATVTVTTETQAPTFNLQIVKVGTAIFAGGNTTVRHDFIAVPNQTYLIEYATDLNGTWTSAGNQSTGTTGSFSVTFTTSGDVAADWTAHMYFRARLVR
jgi:hypothetical protein